MTNLEFPKKAAYRPRKKREEAIPKSHYLHRTYDDYLRLDEQKRLSVVQMDCLEGKRFDKTVLLTLHFVRFNFQIAIKLAEQTGEEVAQALDWLEQICEGQFKQHFGLILTDRGSEFSNYALLEKSRDAQSRRTKIYYCDPRCANQKGSCEKNHVEIRKIIPKGTSLDVLDPYQIATAMCHVNNYTRKSLGGKSPYALASLVLPQRLLNELGYTEIAPDEVCLTPQVIE